MLYIVVTFIIMFKNTFKLESAIRDSLDSKAECFEYQGKVYKIETKRRKYLWIIDLL